MFSHISDHNHCLYHLLPLTAHRSYSLRKRQHGYQLPHIEYNLHKNSLINRCLFNLRWLLFFCNKYHTQVCTLPLHHNSNITLVLVFITPVHHTVLCDLSCVAYCVYYYRNDSVTLIFFLSLLCFDFIHTRPTLCAVCFMHGLFVLSVVVGTAFYVCLFYSCNGVWLSHWNKRLLDLTWLSASSRSRLTFVSNLFLPPFQKRIRP